MQSSPALVPRAFPVLVESRLVVNRFGTTIRSFDQSDRVPIAHRTSCSSKISTSSSNTKTCLMDSGMESTAMITDRGCESWVFGSWT